jgi:hypothetical protein
MLAPEISNIFPRAKPRSTMLGGREGEEGGWKGRELRIMRRGEDGYV